jgi:hypothetical protein
MITTKITGFREAEEALKSLPPAVAKRILLSIGKKALKPLVADMKSRAPRRKGELGLSITAGTVLARSQKRYQGGFMGAPKSAELLVVHAGPGSHPQAVIQEIGSFKEPAQPYVTPAWSAGKDKLLQTIADDLGAAVMKGVKKHKGRKK